MQDVRARGWRATIKPESDAGHRGLRLADNDKISRKGHWTAPRCCRCPFYVICYSVYCRMTKNTRPPMELNLHGERAFCVFFRFIESIRLVVHAQPTVWLHNRLIPNQSTASSPPIAGQCRYPLTLLYHKSGQTQVLVLKNFTSQAVTRKQFQRTYLNYFLYL